VIPQATGGFVPVDEVSLFGKGFDAMAVKKSSGETKSQDVSAAKSKAGGKTSAAKKETAPKKSDGAATKAGASKKPAAAPTKLSASQSELLKKIGGAATGYAIEKKVEQRSIDALLDRKLIKKGAKDKASGKQHYLISTAGKKHLESPPSTA
jgi:hypothetical protein